MALRRGMVWLGDEAEAARREFLGALLSLSCLGFQWLPKALVEVISRSTLVGRLSPKGESAFLPLVLSQRCYEARLPVKTPSTLSDGLAPS